MSRPTIARMIRFSSDSESTLARFTRAQHGQECLLRNLDAADALHALLAGLLLLEQLALARDVAAVALGQHVLAHRPDGLTRDHVRANGRLYRDFEHLARDQLLELVDERTPLALSARPMRDERQRVDGLAGDEDVEAYEVA